MSARGQQDEAAAERSTALALRAGYRSVDTSEAYGNERGVGRAVRDSGLAREVDGVAGPS